MKQQLWNYHCRFGCERYKTSEKIRPLISTNFSLLACILVHSDNVDFIGLSHKSNFIRGKEIKDIRQKYWQAFRIESLSWAGTVALVSLLHGPSNCGQTTSKQPALRADPNGETYIYNCATSWNPHAKAMAPSSCNVLHFVIFSIWFHSFKLPFHCFGFRIPLVLPPQGNCNLLIWTTKFSWNIQIRQKHFLVVNCFGVNKSLQRRGKTSECESVCSFSDL